MFITMFCEYFGVFKSSFYRAPILWNRFFFVATKYLVVVWSLPIANFRKLLKLKCRFHKVWTNKKKRHILTIFWNAFAIKWVISAVWNSKSQHSQHDWMRDSIETNYIQCSTKCTLNSPLRLTKWGDVQTSARRFISELNNFVHLNFVPREI